MERHRFPPFSPSHLHSYYNLICVGIAGLKPGLPGIWTVLSPKYTEKKSVRDHPPLAGILLPLYSSLTALQQPNLLFLPMVLPKLCQHAKPHWQLAGLVGASEIQYVASPPSPGHPHMLVF